MKNNYQYEEQFNSETDLIEEKVTEFCEDMFNYCDSIIVLCTKHNKGTNLTHSIRMSKGNIYANSGLAREWLKQQEQLAIKEDTEDES